MDYVMSMHDFALTEQHLIETRERILNQIRVIAELERSGRPTTVARKILETLLQTQALHARGCEPGDTQRE
jgi:hypothetical protein